MVSDIDFIDQSSVCYLCGEPFGFKVISSANSGNLCQNRINGRYYFSKCRSITYYKGVLATALQDYKYKRSIPVSQLLKKMITRYFPSGLGDCDLVIPVPVHLNKLRERQFNQCAVLASSVADFFGFDYDPFILKKTKDTVAQVDIKKKKDRVKNLKNAFSVNSKGYVRNKKVLLIDDVFTTGTTTNECAKTLVEAGAFNVQVLTLMRASL